MITTEELERLELRELEHLEERDHAAEHPLNLLPFVHCVDPKTGEEFEFQVENPQDGWYWQRDLLLWWMANPASIVLKARQIGVTWLAAAWALWLLLYKPGTRVLVYSADEDEASKVVNRVWGMLWSLPEHLRDHVEVVKPGRGADPYTTIELRHPDGRKSAMVGLPSTKKAGHGETAALVLLDEFAYHEYAEAAWKAALPTTEGVGNVVIVSTANGISQEQNGEVAGNFFHYLWTHAGDHGVATRFIPWSMHPGRDEKWYAAFAMKMRTKSRNESYPVNEHEAFMRTTGNVFFDEGALAYYGNHVRAPRELCKFFPKDGDNRYGTRKVGAGPIRVYQPREEGRAYAISADVASGSGADYSVAYVVDLTSMELVAEFRDKLDTDEFAFQLHFLGRWYNDARIAVEKPAGLGAGYGEAVIIYLKDGKEGRPPYPKLYRHTRRERSDQPTLPDYGLPINSVTRPQMLELAEQVLRERSLPYITRDLMNELETFVHREHGTTPRAMEGAHDDHVLAFCGAMMMYRNFGVLRKPRVQREKRKRPVAVTGGRTY